MAVLTPEQLGEARRQYGTLRTPAVDYTKLHINAALQAIEDFFETNRAALSTAIDAASAPVVFSGVQKKLLVACWLRQKSGRDGG